MSPAERFHTKQRLAERYGLDLRGAQIFQMAKRIAHGHATLITRQSKHVALWLLSHEGQAIRFVFDRRRRSILTALPPEDSAAHLSARAA
jgi:hypothetical protein